MTSYNDRLTVLDDELKQLQGMTDCQMVTDDMDTDNHEDVDKRSIYVGNVDYSTKPQELQEFFKSSGQINRITIMVDKYTGHPKGYAYVEFSNEDAVNNAIMLNESLFKERIIKVIPKRKNIPGFNRRRPTSRSRSRPYRSYTSNYRPTPRF
eukprot:XP_763107.1 hypothetical protein [Theileria parva strain Muguga]